VTDEYGAMVNDEWQVKTEETQTQTSFIATSREENKFFSVFLSLKECCPCLARCRMLRTFITKEK
jgi:hypothetical protein